MKSFYLVIGCALAAQTGSVIAGVPTPDLDEVTLLQKYHIAPTEEGLIGALHNPDAAVRSFAGLKLANNGASSAIQPILQAVTDEKIPGVKIGLAADAARLGSEEGFHALQSMCQNQSGSATSRMVAAQTMVDVVGREECLPDIVDVLRTEQQVSVSDLDGYEATLMALNLLTYKRFAQIPAGQLDEIRELAAKYLKNPAPQIRTAAGMSIRDQGGPWAISHLRAAVSAEQDQAVRESLEKDLLSVSK